MNKIYSSAIVMALVSLVACNKEGVQTVGETLSANAYISPETKTDYVIGNYGEKAGVKVTWSETKTEKFDAYYEGGAKPVIFSKEGAGTSFTAESVPSGVTSSTKFTGLYGSKATLNSDGKIDIDFSQQNGEVDNLAAYDVMTATSELKEGMLSFAFKHNCAILRLKCVNHVNKAVNNVILLFNNATISSAFGFTGFSRDENKRWILSITLKNSSKEGSPIENQGSVDYRYVMVPAMTYCYIGESVPFGSMDAFVRQIDLSKDIRAGYVYDVVCDAGAEGDENGDFWAE